MALPLINKICFELHSLFTVVFILSFIQQGNTSEISSEEALKSQINLLVQAGDVMAINRIINQNTTLEAEFVLNVLIGNIVIAQQKNDQEALAYTYLTVGNFWFLQGNKVKAYENYLQSEQISRSHKLPIITGLSIMNRSSLISENETKTNLLKDAIIIFKEENDLLNLAKAHLNIGNAYASIVLDDTTTRNRQSPFSNIEKNKLDSDASFFRDTAFYHYQIAESINDSLKHDEIFASLNIRFGEWYKFEKDYPTSEHYFTQAAGYFERAGLLKGLVYANLQISEIKILTGNYQQALSLLEKIEETSLNYSYNDYLVETYQLFVKTFNEIGDFRKAFQYQEFLTESIVKNNELKSNDKIHALNLEYTLLEQKKLIEAFNQKKKFNRIMIFLVSFSAVSLLLAADLALKNKRRKIETYQKSILEKEKIYQIQQSLLESRIKNQQLQKKLLQEKVRIRSENLIMVANQMQKIENFLETFTGEIKSLSEPKEGLKTIEEVISLKLPLVRIIQEQNNLKEIGILSDQTNQDFFFFLESHYKNITKEDKKLISYLILDMSSKEIGNFLNISTDSVHKKRYRLRKKLNIPRDKSFLDFYKESLSIS